MISMWLSLDQIDTLSIFVLLDQHFQVDLWNQPKALHCFLQLSGCFHILLFEVASEFSHAVIEVSFEIKAIDHSLP